MRYSLRMSPSEYQDLMAFLGERFETIDRRFDDLRAELLGHVDALCRRLDRLEQEYVAITQALRRIETALLDERARRERLEQDLVTLRENVAVLRARIDDVERRLPAP